MIIEVLILTQDQKDHACRSISVVILWNPLGLCVQSKLPILRLVIKQFLAVSVLLLYLSTVLSAKSKTLIFCFLICTMVVKLAMSSILNYMYMYQY